VKISIVIPAFNEEKLLPGTLDAVWAAAAAFVDAGVEWECIVCDNNSRDGTAEVAREKGARVVFEPVNQIARARNAGATLATGEWILFIDADSYPSRELFADVVREIRKGNLLFAGSVVRLDSELPRGMLFLLGVWNALSRGLRWVAGSFVLVEAAGFREVGGFDLRYYAGEEVDLSRRLKRLARRRRMRAVILHTYPLLTSARRAKLYTMGELGRFFLRATLRPWSTTASREACGMWYDGRR